MKLSRSVAQQAKVEYQSLTRKLESVQRQVFGLLGFYGATRI